MVIKSKTFNIGTEYIFSFAKFSQFSEWDGKINWQQKIYTSGIWDTLFFSRDQSVRINSQVYLGGCYSTESTGTRQSYIYTTTVMYFWY